MRFILACMAAAAIVTIPVWMPPAGAGTQSSAVIALHANSHLQKGDPCDLMDQFYWQGSDCTDFNVSLSVNTSYDLFIVVAGADPAFGVAFASFGIRYGVPVAQSGVDVYSWTPCHSGPSFFYSPTGPTTVFGTSDTGARIYWDAATDCQRTVPGRVGVEAVVGCFYVFAYSADYFTITENNHAPDGSEYIVGDCNGEWSDLELGGIGWDLSAIARFSVNAVEQGNNPCYLVPVRPLSWSRLKTTYGREEDSR